MQCLVPVAPDLSSYRVWFFIRRYEEIAQEIGKTISRGTTGLYGKGMYTNEEKIVLMYAAPRGDTSKIKMIARKIDPRSFIIITNSREVVGLGFKKI